MHQNINDKILDILFEQKKINSIKRDNILNLLHKGDCIEKICEDEKIISQEDLLKLKSELMSIPYVYLSQYNIPPETLNIIPVEVSKNYKMLAFEFKAGNLKVAMVNPYDIRAIEALDFLSKQSNLKTEVYLVLEKDLQEGLKSYHTLGQEVANVLEQTKSEQLEEDATFELNDEAIKTAPVSKVVSVIIRHAVELGASDIHIEPEVDKSKVRYRIDGVLHTSLTLPFYMHNPVISRVKVLAKLKLDENRIPQDGRIKLNIDERKIDLRISTLPLLENEKVSMRILDRAKNIPSIDELGFTGSIKEKLERNIKKPFGMILVTGPTGSGKTTTLYTLINKLNSPDINITTLEDPIEYEIAGVNQSQIQPRIHYTFANGLRSILRQDPDIIMVGEIRDNETAEMAVHAGLTGHLLFSTLHTNNAFGAIPRLIDMKVEPFLLSSTLNAILAQRLVRKICEHCKKEIEPKKEIALQIRKSLENINTSEFHDGFDLLQDFKIFKGDGCKECGGIGYKGRMAIGEILEVTNEVKEIIVSGSAFEDLQKEAQNQKMVTMQQSGFLKVLSGQTTFEEVLRATKDE